MAKFLLNEFRTYNDIGNLTVEADDYQQEGDFITFRDGSETQGSVFTMRADTLLTVRRVEE